MAGPELVFQALDSHDIDIDGTTCRVEVCGVYDDGACRWVQLVIDGAERRMLTLRVRADGPLGNVVSMATVWQS